MSRWTDHRMFDSSIPETRHEAHVFLDNAFWHVRDTANADALGIISHAMVELSTFEQEAA